MLVTGATGFIGSHLTRALVQREAKVSILKRPSSSLARLKDIAKRLRILEADLTDERRLKAALKRSDHQIIFHLAADTNHSRLQKLIKKTFEKNVVGSLNVLNFFLDRPIKVFVNVGTCEEYGDNSAPFHEDMREKPVSPYSASKVAITHYCQMLYKIYDFPAVTLRPFLTYGPYQEGDFLIPYSIKRCLRSLPIKTTKGEQTREFHYVTDIVEGILRAASSKKAIGEIIDLGTGKEYVIREVLQKIRTLTDCKSKWKRDVPYRPGEVMRFYCRGDKARKLLGWKPKVTLTEGIKRTIAWQEKHLEHSDE